MPKSNSIMASPLFNAVLNELITSSNNEQLIDTFCKKLEQNVVLIEDIPGDSENKLLTFFWKDTQKILPDLGVGFLGGIWIPDHDAFVNEWTPEYKMSHATGLGWYRTCKFPSDARLEIAFGIVDSQNPNNRIPPNQDKENYVYSIALPEADKQPWFDTNFSGSKGELRNKVYVFENDPLLKKFHTLATENQSESFKQRGVSVYLPRYYNPSREIPYSLTVCLDGGLFLEGMQLTKTLDALISAEKIAPTVVVFLNATMFEQSSRYEEYACNAEFAKFLAEQFVPRIQSEYNVSKNPNDTILAGVSLSGLAAVYTALEYPNTFGKVLSLSGSLWWYPGCSPDAIDPPKEKRWIVNDYWSVAKNNSGLKPTFYLTAGSREKKGTEEGLYESNEAMNAKLIELGYEVTFQPFKGDHSELYWRGVVANGLIALNKPQFNLSAIVARKHSIKTKEDFSNQNDDSFISGHEHPTP